MNASRASSTEEVIISNLQSHSHQQLSSLEDQTPWISPKFSKSKQKQSNIDPPAARLDLQFSTTSANFIKNLFFKDKSNVPVTYKSHATRNSQRFTKDTQAQPLPNNFSHSPNKYQQYQKLISPTSTQQPGTKPQVVDSIKLEHKQKQSYFLIQQPPNSVNSLSSKNHKAGDSSNRVLPVLQQNSQKNSSSSNFLILQNSSQQSTMAKAHLNSFNNNSNSNNNKTQHYFFGQDDQHPVKSKGMSNPPTSRLRKNHSEITINVNSTFENSIDTKPRGFFSKYQGNMSTETWHQHSTMTSFKQKSQHNPAYTKDSFREDTTKKYGYINSSRMSNTLHSSIHKPAESMSISKIEQSSPRIQKQLQFNLDTVENEDEQYDDAERVGSVGRKREDHYTGQNHHHNKNESTQYLKKFIKLNPLLIDQESKLNEVKLLKERQINLLKSIANRNFEETIGQLKELLSLTAREKHLETFAETIAYIGQFCQCNHDLDNAIYSFLQLKNLSELVGSGRMKMKALTLLAQVMQDEAQLDLSLVLYRRAIHYSWYINDVSAESELYDRLGFLYFMKGDIDKAKYFHERSIQHQSEDIESENRQQSVYTISKFLEHSSPTHTLNPMILAKLGLVTDSQSELRFSTKISAETQIEMLKEDKELLLAQHDPSVINQSSVRLANGETEEEGGEYHPQEKPKEPRNVYQPVVLRNTMGKDSRSKQFVDKSLLKLSIEDKVKKATLDVYDNARLQKKLREAQVSALFNRQNKSQVFFYNHCSPNRNLLGFKYTFKPNSLKTKGYFQRMEQMIVEQE